MEIRTTQAKDRTKADRYNKGIGTSEIFSNNSGKNVRTVKYFINAYSSTAQNKIENISSLEAQASTNTALQHYDRPNFITNTDILRSFFKTTPHNIQFIASSVVQAAQYKAIPNEHNTDPTLCTGNPQSILKPTKLNKYICSKNEPSNDIGGANSIHSRLIEVVTCTKEQCRNLDLETPNKNLLTCSEQILPSKFNTTKHTVDGIPNSNTNQQLHSRKP